MIQSLERQSHPVANLATRAPEKNCIHLIEAHDWMGPEGRDLQADPQDVLIRTRRDPSRNG